MDAADAIDIARAALLLVMTVAGPMLLAALITGVVIGLLQALTQVQEQTLTFVPKMVIMGVALIASLPMIGSALGQFMQTISDHIVRG